MTVKENFAIKGVQTTCGNLRYAKLSNGNPLDILNAAVSVPLV